MRVACAELMGDGVCSTIKEYEEEMRQECITPCPVILDGSTNLKCTLKVTKQRVTNVLGVSCSGLQQVK